MQSLVKAFIFDDYHRSRLTISDPSKIRLVPQSIGSPEGRLQLTELGYKHGKPYYSTDTDLTVTTWITNPLALAAWTGFEAIPAAAQQPAGTSVRYRLNDGTEDLFWDGGAWASAGATDWNTEAEIVDNIDTFPNVDRKIGVVINLVTTDEYETPTLKGVYFLMDCQIDYMRSIVSESLSPSLASVVQPRIDITAYAAGSAQVSLKELETEFNITSVDAVYDEEADPTHETNLLSSYDVDTMNITLTGSVEQGRILWIEMAVEPEVYVNWASQDYVEVEKIPAVVLDNFTTRGNEVFGRQSVLNTTTKTAKVRRSPFRLQLTFEVVLLAEKNRTLLAMQDKALEHASTTRLLPWRAVDEVISLTMLEEGLFRSRPNLSDKHETRYTLRLDDIYVWLRPEEAIPMIERFNLTLASPELGA